MTSVLSSLPLVGDNSEMTTGFFNARLSIISANFAVLDPASVATYSIGSSLSVGRDLWVQGKEIIGAQPSSATGAALAIAVSSVQSDYIQFTDSSAQKSTYVLGSRVGGTSDGLNLWDQSGNTMIVSFSKQSVRFFTPTIGPAFDLGGAVWNVKASGARGDGLTDDTNAFQAGLSALSAVGGGVLQVPSSISAYVITSTLTLTKNIIVAGGGGYNPTILYNDISGAPCFSFLGTSEAAACNCAIQNLTIQGGSSRTGVGIRVRNFSNIFLQQLNISHFSTGIWTDWGQGVYMSGCNISTNTFGCHFGGVGGSGGTRSGGTDFMDWVYLTNNAFSMNKLDIEHKGSHSAHGLCSLFGNTFFENSVGVSGKSYFIHASGLKALDVLHNTFELAFVGSRIAVAIDSVDAEGTSQGTIAGGSIVGNELLLNGGSGNTGVWVKAGTGLVMMANTFETAGNVCAYDLADGADANFIGPSVYSGTPITKIQQSGTSNMVLDSALTIGSIGTMSTLVAAGGTLDVATGSNLVRLFGGSSAQIQLYPAGSSGSAFQIDNLQTNSSPLLRLYTQGSVMMSVNSRQIIAGQDGSAIRPPFTTTSEVSLGWFRSGVSTVALSYGTLNLNQARLTSVKTNASNSGLNAILAANEYAIGIGVSNATLMFRSGNTTYIWGTSSTTSS